MEHAIHAIHAMIHAIHAIHAILRWELLNTYRVFVLILFIAISLDSLLVLNLDRDLFYFLYDFAFRIRYCF